MLLQGQWWAFKKSVYVWCGHVGLGQNGQWNCMQITKWVRVKKQNFVSFLPCKMYLVRIELDFDGAARICAGIGN